MDVTFVGLVCMIRSSAGHYRAAIPDATSGVHPCFQFGNGKTDPHTPLILASGLSPNPTWEPLLDKGQIGLFALPGGPITIGNIAQGPGADATNFRGLRSLKAWDKDFDITLPVGSTQPGCKAWVDIQDGALLADTSGAADKTILTLPGNGTMTVSSSAGSFDVDMTSGSLAFVNASWDTTHPGVSHFYLYYLLDRAPHCLKSPVIPLSLMADCSNTTYP